jgi:hypothetical protein
MGQEFRFEEGAQDMAGDVGAAAEVSMWEVSMWEVSILRFQGMTESIAPMCSTLLTNLARIYRIPVGSGPGPEARRKETRLPIVATSSGRLFLNGLLASIARLCFTGTRNLTCNFTSPGKRGHFYFASEGTFLFCLDIGRDRA